MDDPTDGNIPNPVPLTYSYLIEVKDNVIFYKDDSKDYHIDSFNIIKEYSDGSSEQIELNVHNITDFDSSSLGNKTLKIDIDDFSFTQNIDIIENRVDYIETEDGITITAFTLTTPQMVVPRTINGKVVTKLDWPCFYEDQTIVNVSLPEGLIEIGQGVFESSTIESIIIPDSVTKLNVGSFAGSKLKILHLGNSLEEIPLGAFNNCLLENLIIPDNIKSIGVNAFSKNSISTIEFGNGLEIISDGSFQFNKIEEVNLPNGVRSIGTNSFSSNNLNKIVIPDTISTIEESAFLANGFDIDVTIPDDFNTSNNLILIFGIEPVTVNSVSKPILFDEEAQIQFKKWAEEKQATVINYRYSRLTVNPYELELTIYTRARENYLYIIQRNNSVYEYSEYLNDSIVSKLTSESLIEVILSSI
jgi:hypothetical protein